MVIFRELTECDMFDAVRLKAACWNEETAGTASEKPDIVRNSSSGVYIYLYLQLRTLALRLGLPNSCKSLPTSSIEKERTKRSNVVTDNDGIHRSSKKYSSKTDKKSLFDEVKS